jgi:predicted TIM-barrel fold metal-dependent hydrolase
VTPGRALIISSDGHARAKMEDYRPYLPASMREEFDSFCAFYRQHGLDTAGLELLARRSDPDVVDQWRTQVIDGDRLAGVSDPDARVGELDRNGFAAEVLFPDFGLPFEVGGSTASALLKHRPTPEQITAAKRAHNRWLVEFCSIAPDRFAAMAVVGFEDVDAAVEEIRWAKDAGLKGVVLPHFAEDVPIYHPRFEPIWNIVEELGLPLNSHGAQSSISQRAVPYVDVLDPPETVLPLITRQIMFNCHELLAHLVWGGVLQRHPDMKVVFTEQGSGWVIGELQSMDYTYDGSYLRRDIHDTVRHKPSEYFARQCYLGSSIFSRAEVAARHQIGLDKMALGFDYPHQEGAWAAGPGPVDYLQATLGAAGVPQNEAQQLLATNAASLWDFDITKLSAIANHIGPSMKDVLTQPTADHYPRGDVHKPLGTNIGSA